MKKIILAGITAMSVFLLLGCQDTDVLGNKSVESFGNIVKMEAENITEEKLSGEGIEHTLFAPDMKSSFFWGKNVGISLDIKPFVEAGMDTDKVPKEMILGDKLIISIENAGFSNGDGKADTDFGEFVKANREAIGYHAALDHFGIKLGNGNMFEWAQDTSSNDKDIVFVINPMMISEYGADVTKIEGWLYADVEMMDDKGEKVIEKKLLKPFNLE